MKTTECVRLFDLHHQLLAYMEPAAAVMWLVTKQKVLGDEVPCLLLAKPEGFARICAVISQLQVIKKAFP